ncbi:MAG TPA: hypothetical protein VGO29_01495 [Solirubrobacteraceae bacterium]|nr:hypothetical protein [Solirubrobacteraceae bacterium]
MFNPVQPHELMLGVGRVLRRAARTSDSQELDAYQRGQLLSAYSVVRHLAAEQVAAAALMEGMRRRLQACSERSSVPAARPALAAAMAAREPGALGAQLTGLLRRLGSLPEEAQLRCCIHRALAEMTDEEVHALADAEAEA